MRYEVNSDGTTCTITGVGTCTDTQISIPDTIDGYKVTAIGENAFANCSSVTDIVLSKNIITIGRRAFYSCTSLTEIRIPSSVETFGEQIFYKATLLKTVYCDSLFIGSVLTTTRIEKVVFGCQEIREGMCPSSIKYIELTNNVTRVEGSAFSGYTGLISITVDEKNTKYHSAGNCLIETATKTLAAGCRTSIIPSDGSVESIGYGAFFGCTGLTSIPIPDSVTSIGSAFSGCTGLTSIIIPDGVTSIEHGAFYGCISLTSVTIPDSVTSIGEEAFSDCRSLTSITFQGTMAQWNQITKGNNWKPSTKCTIHCIDGDIEE